MRLERHNKNNVVCNHTSHSRWPWKPSGLKTLTAITRRWPKSKSRRKEKKCESLVKSCEHSWKFHSFCKNPSLINSWKIESKGKFSTFFQANYIKIETFLEFAENILLTREIRQEPISRQWKQNKRILCLLFSDNKLLLELCLCKTEISRNRVTKRERRERETEWQ